MFSVFPFKNELIEERQENGAELLTFIPVHSIVFGSTTASALSLNKIKKVYPQNPRYAPATSVIELYWIEFIIMLIKDINCYLRHKWMLNWHLN